MKDTVAKKDSAAEAAAVKEFKFFMVLANIPSPAHEVLEVKNAGMKYNAKLPNPVENESKYNETFKAAINYGIYSTDLAYVASFKDNGDLIKYLAVTRKTAEKAGALSKFEEIMKQEHFEDHIHNSDSLEMILDKAHLAIEKFCEESHKLDIAAKYMLGSWIETQYLTLSQIKGVSPNAKNKILFEKVWQNWLHLRNLLDLLKEYNSPELVDLGNQLQGYGENYKDTHGADDFNKEKISKMADEITFIRNKLVN
jgi:hypothetical protein